MIPYDDLVVALATWRAKQGLSVGQMPAPSPTPVASAAPAAPAPSTGSGSGPKRSGPPGAPPAPTKAAPSGRTAAPAPLPLPAETLDVEEHMVDDDPGLETVDEFGHAFANLQGESDEATSIGSAPGASHTEPGHGPLDPKGSIRPPGGNRNDDW